MSNQVLEQGRETSCQRAELARRAAEAIVSLGDLLARNVDSQGLILGIEAVERALGQAAQEARESELKYRWLAARERSGDDLPNW